jgi:signal transduction histidine kinase
VIIALIVFYRWRFEHEKRSLQVRRATFAAREQEKLRFSRELHDDFQSTLSIIHMMASHEHTKSPDNNHFEELKNSAKNAMREIRKMSEVLYPSEINTEGLFESLKSLIKRKNDSNSSVFFHLSAKYFDCDKALQLVIYRSVEDLIEETVKFSRAKEVYVAVNLIKKRIELCYTEKGNDIIREELDFQIIHERISALGGKLIVVRVHSNLSEIKVIYIV